MALAGALVLLSPVAIAQESPEPTCSALAADASTPADADGPLIVFAAASLTDAFEALAPVWTTQHPEHPLTFSFDASSTLRAQIEQGAPADLLVSADLRNAELLVGGCYASAPVTPFVGNELMLVVPADGTADITSPADLAQPGVRVVMAGPEVPINRYAVAVIENLAALEGYPADFAEAVTANVVSEEDNVRAVLTKIELGEGDAAFVYTTDALSSEGVRALAIPDEANIAAAYGAVRVLGSDQPAAAQALLDFLLGEEAQAILADFGFVPPSSRNPAP